MNMKPIIAISLVAIATTAAILAGCSSPTGYQTGSRAATALTQKT